MTRHLWKRIGSDKAADYDACERCDLIKRTVVKAGAWNNKRVVRYARLLKGPWVQASGTCSPPQDAAP